jgi:hypothetical protein
MAAIVNYHGLDENAISVPCRMSGCEKRVYRDVRCREHGGDPDYEWSESLYGDVKYTIKQTPGGAK